MNEKKVRIECQGAAKLPIGKIEPFQGELKSLSSENYDRLKKSILELGFSFALQVWRHKGHYYCIDGHQRDRVLTRMAKEGYEVPPVPVDWVEAADEQEAKRKILAGTSNFGKMEKQGLYQFIEDAGLDAKWVMDDYSFPEIDPVRFLQEYYVDPPKADEDDVRSLPAKAKSRRGDIYVLGDHRVMCGDSTRDQDVDNLMAGKKAAMVFTDPPYGVDYVAMSGKHDKLKGDEKHQDDLIRKLLTPAFKLMVKKTLPKAAFYIWHDSRTRDEFTFAMKAAGIQERETIIWVKPNFIMGWGDYRRMHETCFYAARAGESPEFYGDRAQPTAWRIGLNVSNVSEITIDPGLVITDGHGNQLFIQAKVPKAKKLRHFRLQDPKDKLVLHSEQTSQTVWEVARDHGNEHPTQKPVELARRAIENSSRPGGLVLDLFLGSGTTLIGAETTGRTCYGMEMDPKYMDVIVDRWESLTGKNAVKCDQT